MFYLTFNRELDTGRTLLCPASPIFESIFDFENLTTDLAKMIVREIDKSEVISANLIQSPVLGPISPLQLSGGCKAVLLALTEDQMISSVNLGDNCMEPLLKVSEIKDVYVQCTCPLFMPDRLYEEYQIYSLDKNRFLTSARDFLVVQADYIDW